MILIADSGSTKTSWLLVENGEVIMDTLTSGYNPYYYHTTSLTDALKLELMPHLVDIDVKKIFFYGSGCSTEKNCLLVKSTLWQLFPNASVEVNHDLYGAAVALLKSKPGIACILGTGSNSCNWDGKNITQNVPSLGYLLGDEGSGTYIGMKILKGILEEKAPEKIINAFYKKCNCTFEDVLNLIYNEPKANKYFSELCLFAGDNLNNPWIYNTIKQSFIDFIECQIVHYSNYQNLPVSFTGSIAFHFKNILLEACSENNINVGLILKNPIDGLFTFHSEN